MNVSVQIIAERSGVTVKAVEKWLSEQRIPQDHISYVPGPGQGGKQLRINPKVTTR